MPDRCRRVLLHRLPPLVLLALACGAAAADALLAVRTAAIEGEGWRAEGVAITLQRDDAGRLAAHMSVARLELPAPLGTQQDVHVECQGLELTMQRFACRELAFAAAGMVAEIRLAGRAEFRRDTGGLRWDLVLPAAAPGLLRVAGSLDAGHWTLRLEGEAVALESLAALAGPATLDGLGGELDLSVFARGAPAGLAGLVFEFSARDASGANATGTAAAEGLGLELRGSLWPDEEGLAFDMRGGIANGEIYLEPVYANLAVHPLRLVARGVAALDRASIGQLVLDQHGIGLAEIAAGLERTADERWTVRQARLRLVGAEFPGAYTTLLQPLLAGTPFAELDTAGSLRGEFGLRDGALTEAWLELGGLDLDDRQARLALYGLTGELHWTAARAATRPPPPSTLRWSGGFVYGIPVGAAGLQLEPRGRRWALAAPVSIPVLDGALEVERLEFGDPLAGDPALLFDARLTPLDMRGLSLALGWPPLSGQLSGTLPELSYEDGILTLGGELMAEVFRGVVAVRALRIERPLQPLTRLQAEVELHGLQLAELTEALSFGLMTGRLDGYVRGLEMIDWRPVAFDARLYTPPEDRTRKRISQRAVDNIANLGGGDAGVLSAGFLRFFESFSYEAFALGCRLERDVCQMSGLVPSNDGYVILRGRGLPRIDVLGYARRVDWSVLVAQLAAILEAEAPEFR